MIRKLVLAAVVFLLCVGFANAQSDDELKALGKIVEKAGKMVRDKGLKQAMNVCTGNVESARSKRKRDPKAVILTELKNIQVQLRIVAPMAAGQDRAFKDAVTSGLLQVAQMVVANGGYATTVRKSGGLQIITLSTPEGSVRLNVPGTLKLGEAASGSISADPMVSAGYLISLGGQLLALERRIAPWVIPNSMEQVVLALKTREGIDVLNIRVPIRNTNSTSVEDPGAADLAVEAPPDEIKVDLQIPYLKFRLSSIGWIGSPLEIQGPFDGNFTNTTVRFDGIAASIVAENPRSVVVQPPADRYGVMTISVQEGKENVSCVFRNLWVTALSPRTQLVAGESTTMTLIVRGLRGLAKPVVIQLDNTNPGTAVLEGGSHQAIVVAPADIRPDGSYELKRIATGIQVGLFQTSVSVNSSAFLNACEPPE